MTVLTGAVAQGNGNREIGVDAVAPAIYTPLMEKSWKKA